jgi:hypothetical protein
MLCAIIFGISILIALPRSAMIINMLTNPEYGFSKLNKPGLCALLSEVGDIGLFIYICNNLQRNSIKPVIQ